MTEVSKHTPGSLEVLWCQNDEKEWIVQKTDGSLEPVAFVKTSKEDARLFAAAPSLLADLKFLVDYIEENGRLAGQTERAITNFTATYRYTIAKAEGGAS